MQTALIPPFKDTAEGQEADAILRKCVHCGFCTATCPTYQLLGDELDGPRGRIYLIKQALEGHAPTRETQVHLDRCLTCLACETTCPSGVEYRRLVEIGRAHVDAHVSRPFWNALKRAGLRAAVPRMGKLTPLSGLMRSIARPSAPAAADPTRAASHSHSRTMLVLQGCAQAALAPEINAAAARVLDRFGISLIREPRAGCCGALNYHNGGEARALDEMRRNIDAWLPALQGGTEAIVFTASGCGVTIKDYGKILQHDVDYAEKAAFVAALARDIGEVIAELPLPHVAETPRMVFHSPCSLQHGLRLNGLVEGILQRVGFSLPPVSDAHLCCGSAGAYSLLQPKLARRLRDNKLNALQASGPALIATANIGCLMHLQGGTQTPVKHWIEVLDAVLPPTVAR